MRMINCSPATHIGSVTGLVSALGALDVTTRER